MAGGRSAVHRAQPRAAAPRAPPRIPEGMWLVLPAVLFLIVFFVLPVLTMVRNGFNVQLETGVMAAGFTLDNYLRFFTGDLYWRVLWTTLRVGLITTVLAIIVAFPLALIIARGSKFAGRLILVIVVSPLLINIVVRTFGWRIVLGQTGLVNWLLDGVGIGGGYFMLYTEGAIVVGSLHVFLALMVLPLANAIAAIPPSLEESSAVLGAGRFETFLKVVLPLSLPGIGAGSILVFTLTSSSFVLPAILGGDFSKMLGTLVEEQLLAVGDWPFGAAIATILMLVNLSVVLGYVFLVERRMPVLSGRRT